MATPIEAVDRTHALLTPGQGNQKIGMGAELAKRSEAAGQVWAMADQVLFPQLGYRLTDVAWNLTGRTPEDAEAELQNTLHAQLAITTDTLASKAAMEEAGLLDGPGYHAGNSVGMIAALVNAGSLSIEGAVHLAKGRGEAFRLAIDQGPKTTMMSLVGVDQEIIDEVREKYDLEVCLINTPRQIVLGGPIDNIGEAAADLEGKGLRDEVHKLRVDAAFHSKYMEAAVPVWEKVVADTGIVAPKYGEVVGGSTVTVLSTPEAIRRELVLQLTNTENYAGVIKFLARQGVRTMTEINPTSSRLTKMHMETLGIPQEPRPFERVNLPKAAEGDKVLTLGYRLPIPASEQTPVTTEVAATEEKVSKDEVLSWYLDWISNRTGIEVTDLNEGMHFTEDANLDSEDLKALRAALRANFGKVVPDEEAAKNVLISMAVDATYKLVNS